MKQALEIGMLVSMFLAAGCGGGFSTIKVLGETNTGGEIALVGGQEYAMDLAKPVMAAKCGGNEAYQIVRQQPQQKNEEVRITYECKGEKRDAANKPVQGSLHQVQVKY